MLNKIRDSLRITGKDFDEEIKSLILSAKEDLILSGVDKTAVQNENIELVTQAIKLYCKANFGYDNPESEKFRINYELVRNKLALCYGVKR